ncbi:hypothetical protein ES702_04082 [subsurface metagenome]
MRTEYLIGVDLGQSFDSTAIAIIKKVWELKSRKTLPGTIEHDREYPGYQAGHTVVHLERPELGTKYTEVVDRVHVIKNSSELQGSKCELLVDATGVGRPIVDMLERKKLNPIAITITGGKSVVKDPQGTGFFVPKRDLVSCLLWQFQAGRLVVLEDLELANVLCNELENFRSKISLSTGIESYESWRENQHDDLVLAIALPVWFSVVREGAERMQPDPRLVKLDQERNRSRDPLHRGWGHS